MNGFGPSPARPHAVSTFDLRIGARPEAVRSVHPRSARNVVAAGWEARLVMDVSRASPILKHGTPAWMRAASQRRSWC
jgi:hypothetical protein